MFGATRFLGELQAPIGQGPGHVQFVAHNVERAQTAQHGEQFQRIAKLFAQGARPFVAVDHLRGGIPALGGETQAEQYLHAQLQLIAGDIFG